VVEEKVNDNVMVPSFEQDEATFCNKILSHVRVSATVNNCGLRI
jgi:hypothetical protein